MFKIFNRNKFAQGIAVPYEPPDPTGEKEVNTAIASDVPSERPSEDVQAGVKKVEAVTLTWTKRELVFAYGW
jgi:hypothetical protein